MKHSSDDEYLEALWVLEEDGKPRERALANRFGDQFDPARIDELAERRLVSRGAEGEVRLTEAGRARTRRLIRAHRIAERLIHDVLGGEFESGACEFEHITSVGMVDAICTLLGHPRECPHGLPIPEGECCRQSLRTIQRSVIPLTELDAGQSARIAYVYSQDDSELHIVEGLQIRPGVEIRVHQKYPTYVLEVDGINVALGTEVASNIQVWADTASRPSDVPPHTHRHQRRRLFRGRRHQ